MFVPIMYILSGLYIYVFMNRFCYFRTHNAIQPLLLLLCIELIEYYIYFKTENILYSILLDFIYILIIFKDSILKKVTFFALSYFTIIFAKFFITMFLEIPHIIHHNPDTSSIEYLLITMIVQIIEYIQLFIISKFYKNQETFKLTYITLIPISLLISTVYWNNNYWFHCYRNQPF